jgi:elongation factor G
MSTDSADYPPPETIRNICLCGHTGAGKTTLCERLLFAAGQIKRMGDVESGNTVSDYTEQERHHKHSLQPSVIHFDYEGHHVNIIDTPGMSDFIGNSLACFPAVETVVVVVNATRGVENETRQLMKVAVQRNLPRMILINKIDLPDLDLGSLIDSIRQEFGEICLPINMPIPDRSKVIDVFETDAHETTAFSSAETSHRQIVEQVVEVDDELTESYLEAGEAKLNPLKLHDAFEKALRDGHLVPIVFASAKSGAGIEQLLHVAASLLPSPLEGNPRPFVRGDEPMATEFDPHKPAVAHIFRVETDQHIGKLGIFRVHQGVVRSRSEMYLDDLKKPLRIGHVMRLQGKEHCECNAVGPGEIGAVSKVDEIHFDGVLHDGATPENPPHLVSAPLPKPLFGLAVQLKSHADETKFSAAIQRLQAEDPCFRLERIAATKQTVMLGLGELHLRVALEKLKSIYGIELLTSAPKIAYRETITITAEGHCRHKKQTGGAGQFGEVYLRVSPLDPDHPTGFEFANATVGGSIPKQFMPAIEKGVRQVLQDGAVAGYPLSGVAVEVFDGKHHPVDSKEIAFVAAGRKAFLEAIRNARPTLLEPFVEVDISFPNQYMGDITADLSTRRGRVNDTRTSRGLCTLKATAPLAAMQNYSTQLRSLTSGAGNYSMQLSHFEPAPPDVQKAEMAAFKHSDDD